jgi:hypothetical protein
MYHTDYKSPTANTVPVMRMRFPGIMITMKMRMNVTVIVMFVRVKMKPISGKELSQHV